MSQEKIDRLTGIKQDDGMQGIGRRKKIKVRLLNVGLIVQDKFHVIEYHYQPNIKIQNLLCNINIF